MNSRTAKAILGAALLALAVSGCATRGTVESRKQERYGAYSALTPEQRSLVDQGKIAVGLPMDAVYIAWGKPDQVAGGESDQGSMVTWLYAGTYLQEYRYWGYRPYYYGRKGHYYGSVPRLEYDYAPQNYVSAEVIFEKGVVKQWRTIPHPP